MALRLYSSAEFRAVFSTPTNEGLRGDVSPTVSVTVGSVLVGTLPAARHRALTGRKETDGHQIVARQVDPASSPSAWPSLAALVLVAVDRGPGATSPAAPRPPPAAARRPPACHGRLPPPAGRRRRVAGRDAPPDALLAAEGGDPSTGQLGTYVWLDSGSDSPWLPGRSARGRGRRAADPHARSRTVRSRAWAARYVPAGRPGPRGRARPSATAPAAPRFDAPGPGDWTVEVFVEFAPGVGRGALLLASRGGVNRPGVAHCRRWAPRWPPSPVDPVAAPRRPSPSFSSSPAARPTRAPPSSRSRDCWS